MTHKRNCWATDVWGLSFFVLIAVVLFGLIAFLGHRTDRIIQECRNLGGDPVELPGKIVCYKPGVLQHMDQ